MLKRKDYRVTFRLLLFFAVLVCCVCGPYCKTESAYLMGAAALCACGLVVLLPQGDLTTTTTTTTGKEKAGPLLLMLLLCATGIRMHKLGELPFGMWFDEAENVRIVKRILFEPGYWPIFIGNRTQLPAFLFYLMAPFVYLFPSGVEGVRVFFALLGVLSIVATYLLTKKLYGPLAASIAALFLTFSHWHITFSRVGMHQISTAFFFPVVAYFLVDFVDTKRFRSALLAGATLGLAVQTYYSCVILLPVTVMYLGVACFKDRSLWRKEMVAIPIAAAICYAPLGLFALQNWRTFSERFRTVSNVQYADVAGLFHFVTGDPASDGARRLIDSAIKHLMMFHITGDGNGRHNLPGAPMLDPIFGALFLVGLMFVLVRPLRTHNVLLLLWLFGVTATGVLSLSFEAPQAGRTLANVSVIGVLIGAAAAILHRNRAEREGAFSYLLSVAGMLLLVFAVGLECKTHIAHLFDRSSWLAFNPMETKIGMLLNSSSSDRPVLVQEIFGGGPTQELLAPNKTPLEIHMRQDLLLAQNMRGGAIFLESTQRDLERAVMELYPHATKELFLAPTFGGTSGPPAATTFRIEAEDVRSLYTLTGRCTKRIDIRGRNEVSIEWDQEAPRECVPSVTFGLLVDSELPVSVLSPEIPMERLLLDGTSYHAPKPSHSVSFSPAIGEHELELVFVAPRPAVSTLRIEDGKRVRIAAPRVYSGGLTGRYFKGGAEETLHFSRIDNSLHYYFHRLPLPLPFSVVWNGSLKIQEAGEYGFHVSAVDSAQLIIDGSQLAQATRGSAGNAEKIFLNAGLHPIEVHYQGITGYSQIVLSWKVPGSVEFVTVPGSHLVPMASEVNFY